MIQLKDEKITHIKKNRASSTNADTYPNLDITQSNDFVNKNLTGQEELDKQYFAAIEAGDMETVQKLVDEQTERKRYNLSSDYQGTSAFNGADPYRNGYYDTKEERLQAIQDETFEDTQTLGDFAYDNADA